ncbi:MAG: hypothetical protein ACTSQI_10440 [Candidatus Helarchaeota archaeon]
MSSRKKKGEACIWNRRGKCHGMVEKLTEYEPDQWSRIKPGKALESDYSIHYCQLCLMSKIVDNLETINETIEKFLKKFVKSPLI